MPQPWERLTTESAQAYAAFCVYRDMGAGRSVVRAYEQSGGKEGAKQASGRWNGWAKRHRWAERAKAFDDRIEAAELKGREKAAESEAEELERKRREWVEVEYKLALALGRTIAKQLRNDDARGAGANLEAASKLARRSLRMPSDIDEPPPADWKVALFETSGQFADMLPLGAMPTMPEDVLAKPKIDTAGTVAATGAVPSQPLKAQVRP